MDSSTHQFDAIVIGAGHNGLVAAAYLAQAGLKVCVLERRQVLGGAAGSEPVFPGFRVDTGTFDAGLFLPEIVSDLHLETHGLRFIAGPAVIHALQPGGGALTLWRDPGRTAQEIAPFSPADASRYPAYLAWLDHIGAVLQQVLRLAPPPIPNLTTHDLLSWLPVAIKARRLGRKDMMELVRLLPMPVSDFLDEWFESKALKAALGMAGVFGNTLGPKSPGTAIMLLYQAMNAGEAGFRASAFVQGGMGCMAQALADAARGYGAEVYAGLGVRQIMIEDGIASGVLLEDGKLLNASVILSSLNPRQTFFDLVGASNLEVHFVREVRNIRYRGSLARVNLALSGLPSFRFDGQGTSIRDRLSGRILVCPDLDHLERAYDEAKYGLFPRRLVLDAAIPTLADPSLAPAGMHLMEINVQYPPYFLKGSSWDEQRDSLGEHVVELLAEYAPDIQTLITGRQVLTPLDLERQYGLAEGCIYHGQMTLDQLLFMRPVPGYSAYRSPVEGLYMCGSGAHPGGGLTGAPGRNAARTVLKRRRRA
jgi:phytoene dehydrogenase-like protein